MQDLVRAVLGVLRDVGLGTDDEEEATANGVSLAPRTNTWSRAARRAGGREGGGKEGVGKEGGGQLCAVDDSPPLFRALLSFKPSERGASLVLEWTYGDHRDIVDAFWKFLIAKAGLGKRPRETNGHHEQPQRYPKPRTT